MRTLSTSAPSCSRQRVLRVRPPSADRCRTGVSRPGSSAVVSSSRTAAGRSVICAGSVIPRKKCRDSWSAGKAGCPSSVTAARASSRVRSARWRGGVPRRGASKTSGRAVMASSMVPLRREPAPETRQRSRTSATLHGMTRLDDVDLTVRLSKKDYKKQLAEAQERMVHLRLLLGGQIGPKELGPPLCVVFEGWDASGKGGAIQRLVGELDPRHVRVAQFAAPTHDEKRHHFLWRFWPKLPGWGGMAVLDRSWYGRVLVERVEEFAPEEAWRRAYQEIVELEDTLAAEGTVIVKFWMHVSPEEQLRRFESRRDDPYRAWKLTDEDWRNRGKREEHAPGVEDMLERPDTAAAPWHVIPADDKRWARVAVPQTVCEAIEAALAARGIAPDAPVTAPA